MKNSLRVTCYQRSQPDQACEVFINKDYIVSCARAFEGGDAYAWLLTMSTGHTYAISQADFLNLKVIDHKNPDYSVRHLRLIDELSNGTNTIA